MLKVDFSENEVALSRSLQVWLKPVNTQHHAVLLAAFLVGPGRAFADIQSSTPRSTCYQP